MSRASRTYLFECDFPSGHRVCVNTNGVSIWDSVDGRWVIDASTIVNDNSFSIGSEIYDRAKRFPVGSSPILPGSYLRSKPRIVERKSK